MIFFISIKTIDECVLGVSLQPLQYNNGFNNVELKVTFKSNCLNRPALIIFMTPYDEAFEMTSSFHPKKVRLSIMGRIYNLDFSEANTEETEGGVNVKYGMAKIEPAELTQVSTMEENNILLRTNFAAKFKYDEINSLYFANNPCLCSLIENKTTIYCEI